MVKLTYAAYNGPQDSIEAHRNDLMERIANTPTNDPKQRFLQAELTQWNRLYPPPVIEPIPKAEQAINHFYPKSD